MTYNFTHFQQSDKTYSNSLEALATDKKFAHKGNRRKL